MTMHASIERTKVYLVVRQFHANNRTNDKSAKAKEAIHCRKTASFNLRTWELITNRYYSNHNSHQTISETDTPNNQRPSVSTPSPNEIMSYDG